MPQYQRPVSVKLYPEEIEALEVIAKIAGWDGKSTALREFMKIWVEVAIVTIEKDSSFKGTAHMLKSMIRLNKQIKTIQDKSKESKETNTLHQHDLAILKDAMKPLKRKYTRVLA